MDWEDRQRRQRHEYRGDDQAAAIDMLAFHRGV
jgi:hypothetical protein